ncbi:WD repeat protein [Grosmannia clavigera kw1407]|uniref:WD repeat protein n=1 Tax=Grosmannia clavigera (strain kw1407 / UAMH 11150) TaxID=655863 RepID=F0XV50_GROCL|nr:WD repeat protein [Grosmannia clavigera kw1407]EFW98425.1 WD repeat protein [Grosmannia clavigera kw1407]
MASKKVRQKISYVLEIDPLSVGHRLGVNGLAYDSDNSILYSGGRDGVVCAWDMHLDQPKTSSDADKANDNDTAPKPVQAADTTTDGSPPKPAVSPARQTATSRAQTQAHMHWINDIVLAQNNSVLVTASSDLLVKAWRPRAGDNNDEPAILGRHEDYAKCVASPGQQATWVASGGLDRRIRLWDLQGGGNTNQILEIDVSGEERAEKGSVYALRATHSLLASGGPESTVRLWDPRTGKNITKFVGHTDNVRAILINGAGDTVLTASSDQTVKVWSVTAGRCMHTLTMHNDSVWSLYADRPDLGIFYSGDRSGLVVKTDVRGSLNDMDAGFSVAVAQEHGGVNKVVASDGFIWTSTSSSSINRWRDVDTGAALQRLQQQQLQQSPRPFSPADTMRPHSSSVSTVKSGGGGGGIATLAVAVTAGPEIPPRSILRISNTATFPRLVSTDTLTLSGSSVHGRKNSEVATMADEETATAEEVGIEPIQRLPVETIEGNFGLVKHRLLNDRRRALTLDTAGEVLLWDLIRCKQLRRFGKRHLEDVEPEVNTTEAVAPWCSIDVSSGNLMVVLDAYNCFDAEMYADELVLDEPFAFREDQRINLGKWILRYLFANLIDEEVRRDDVYLAKINEVIDKRIEAAALAAAAAAEAAAMSMLDVGSNGSDGTGDKRGSQASRSSAEREENGLNGTSSNDGSNGPGLFLSKTTTGFAGAEASDGAKDANTTAKSPGTPFGKKFRMGMSFGTKKLGRSASTSVPEKTAGAAAGATPAAGVDGTVEEGLETGSSSAADSDASFVGVVQRMRAEYERQLAATATATADQQTLARVESRITPCPVDEAPPLQLPANTMVMIHEELQGGSMEVYRGTIATAGRSRDVDKIERCAPRWLAEALLANSAVGKESYKVSFILLPYRKEGAAEATLPNVATPDGSSRLNANRMLRVKKILAYVSEKIEGPVEGAEQSEAVPGDGEVGEEKGGTEKKEESVEVGEAAEATETGQGAEMVETAETSGPVLRPEEYLELYCNEQLTVANSVCRTR